MPQIVVFPNGRYCELQLVDLTGVVRLFMLYAPVTGLGGCSMDKSLDIFRIVPEGVRWMATVEGLEVAKALIKAKSAEQPGDFLVASIATGWKMEIKAPGDDRVAVADSWRSP